LKTIEAKKILSERRFPGWHVSVAAIGAFGILFYGLFLLTRGERWLSSGATLVLDSLFLAVTAWLSHWSDKRRKGNLKSDKVWLAWMAGLGLALAAVAIFI
jgi:hypothetical protein